VVDDGTLAARRGSLNIDDEAPHAVHHADREWRAEGYLQDEHNARLMA